MSFDDIIPLLFFLGYIGFVFLKRKPRKAKPPGPEKTAEKQGKTGSKFSLSGLIDTIKKEIEQAAIEARKKQESQQQPYDYTEETKQEPESAWYSEQAEGREEDQKEDLETLRPEGDLTQLSPLQSMAQDSLKKSELTVTSISKKKKRRTLVLTKSKLQEAVILSEIISSPIALREKPRY